MRILYITSDNVENPICGCAQRSRFIFDALQKNGAVDIFRWQQDMVQESAVAKVFRKLTKVARWPFGAPSINLHLHLPPTPKYDAVVCRYLMTAAMTQAWLIAPCYVDIDDMPTEAFDSVDSKRLPPILRPLGGMLVRWWQNFCLKKCMGAWAVSDNQVEIVRELGVKKVGLLPNLARRPGENYNVNHPQENLLMTVGFMGYGPNQEGVGWFLANIWPKVHERWPDMTYAVAGGGLPETLKAKWSAIPGVRVFGFVDDLDALYAKSLAVVTPILSGAGTCIKVVEAGLHGRFVLATPKAVRGHEALMTIGGIKVFEDAAMFCNGLSSWLATERSAMQTRLVIETCRVNSVESFDASTKEVLV